MDAISVSAVAEKIWTVLWPTILIAALLVLVFGGVLLRGVCRTASQPMPAPDPIPRCVICDDEVPSGNCLCELCQAARRAELMTGRRG